MKEAPVTIGWPFAPVIAVALLAYLAVYLLRWRRVRRDDGARAAPLWRLFAFLGGILTIALALLTPVDLLGEQFASAHMVQHLLLADIAAILLILGFTRVILRPVTRWVHRIERAAGPLAHPVFGVVAYVGVMAVYHLPTVYDGALRSGLLHSLGHLAFMGAGLLYWWHLLSPIRSRLRLGGMGPIFYMASTKILVGFLGLGLAFSPDRLYESYGSDDVGAIPECCGWA